MNKLEQLIQELCPHGVEYKKLGEVCIILDNERKPISKEKRENGMYPYYGANGIQDYVDNYIFDGTFLLVGEDGSVINADNTPKCTPLSTGYGEVSPIKRGMGIYPHTKKRENL